MSGRYGESNARVLVPALSYAAACIAGGVVFTAGLWLASDDLFAPIVLAALPILVAAFSLVLLTPVAVPTIVFTERRGKALWWQFLIAGLGGGLLLIGIFFAFESEMILRRDIDWLWSRLAVLTIGPTTSLVAYWLLAWHFFPPRSQINETLDVFE